MEKFKLLDTYNQQCYIKRDDTIGGLCNGSKQRKFLSIIPYLIDQNYAEVIVIGGAYSNNVTAIIPYLIQNNIKPILFLRGEPNTPLTGNFLYTRIFVPETDIHWFSREQWPQVLEQAQNYVKSMLYKKTGIIPEGSFMLEALWGSLTLPLDIINNEQEMSVHFDHIFIEVGTGGTAAALLIGLTFMKRFISVHILLLAEDENQFRSTLNYFQHYFEEQTHIKIDMNKMMKSVYFYTPSHYKSFGSVGSKIFNEIINQARSHGILFDPIYAIKLIQEGLILLNERTILGNIMFIHNGGTLGLMGYEKFLQKVLK